MKRKALMMTMVLVAVIMVVTASAYAMNVGMPESHGLTGREFGAAVSALAKSEPGAVAEHVGKKPEMPEAVPSEAAPSEESMAGGIPAVHGLTGKEFGAAVSALAKSEPGAVAAHVGKKPELPEAVPSEVVPSEAAPPEASMAGGIPEVHGVSGMDFGAAVSGLAKTEPGAVAAHVRK